MPAPSIQERPRIIAKLIVYATADLTAPEIAFGDDTGNDPFAFRSIADVPWPGTRFAAGEPVMTLFARGENVADCRSQMSDLEKEWLRRLGAVDWLTSREPSETPSVQGVNWQRDRLGHSRAWECRRADNARRRRSHCRARLG